MMAVLNEAVGHLKTLAENGTSTAFSGVNGQYPAIETTKLLSIANREIVPTTSRLALAVEWLKSHIEDRKLSGEKLEAGVFPYGIKINRTYWNRAKKQLSAENIEEHER